MADKDKYKVLKTAMDIASFLFIGFLLIICPISAHYNEHIHDPNGNLTFMVRAMSVDAYLCALGLVWLAYRYSNTLHKKYPVLDNQRLWNRVKWLIIPVVWLIMYLAETFWR